MPSVVADTDVGRGVLERYVRPLERDGRAGATVLHTVWQYLEHDCQIPETAAALGVHRNTVRYRISRFEQRAGLLAAPHRHAGRGVVGAAPAGAGRINPISRLRLSWALAVGHHEACPPACA